ncbi:MAG: dienelactone hydrolase family protein [Actinomycetota bacterium]
MSFRRIMSILLVLVLIAAACGDDDGGSDDTAGAGASTQASTTTTGTASTTTEATDTTTTTAPTTTTAAPTTTTAAPALPELGSVGLGPYGVGVQTITITDGTRNRPLTVDVWFPLADDSAGDLVQYTFVTGDFFESARALAVDVSSASTDGPFPLVVYSHGSGGIRYIHSDYTETIASHGYVVVAPDHTGNTSVERVLGTADDAELIAYNRPLDVITVIDAMVDPANAEAGPYAALVDPESIAVTGHSFGGYTTYAVASGTTGNPNGDTPADDRIDALIPLAPAVTGLLPDDTLALIDQPTLIIVGADDKTTPVDPHVEDAWEASNAVGHYRVELIAGEHQSFTDLCDYVEVLPGREGATEIVVETITLMAQEGCSDGDMPIERVKELTNTFAVTFLESVFGDGEMITADTNTLPDDIVFAAK